ncbi:cyclase family protein [Paenibacillus sp. JMULE4]|uniref:cyclase family protein n=1 Tax=Paenibacillus sp. JMULE4 TaxID=2518342 RepID=UPI0020C5D67D|nr:cyclase family protein [Paenibacillus sp. JMULE4]
MRVIDLSETIMDGMTVYPGDPEVKVEVVHTREEHTWELRQLTLGTHTGTHVDAFSHMHQGGNPSMRFLSNDFSERRSL